VKELAPALACVVSALVLLTAWRALPVLIWLVFPSRLRVRFEDPLLIEAALSGSSEIQAWVQSLRQEGFRVMGIKTERLPLWGREVRELALVSQAFQAYASIVLRRDGTPTGIYLDTPMSAGPPVLTSNTAGGLERLGTAESIQILSGADVGEVLAVHQAHLRERSAGGAEAIVDPAPEARIRATREMARWVLRPAAGALMVREGVLLFLLATVLLGVVLIWWRLS
jgi:hypothetical protein